MKHRTQRNHISRRCFLQGTSLVIASSFAGLEQVLAGDDSTALNIGLITDLHYADKEPSGTRYYRETLAKIDETSREFAKPESRPTFLIELGDLVDAADSAETELRYLSTINGRLQKICERRYYVLGNHCVDTLTKNEFLGHVEQERTFYSFDEAGFHFIVLDACFRKDGEPYGRKNFQWTDTAIPESELTWLQSDLKATQLPTIVLVHQRLDVSDNHGVKNCEVIRQMLEAHGKVMAVFQGHS
ncbi:MAG: metallophosphoesterase, partial [Planctomycetaceae bacterium]|nr:metallophosphoesterase [Planctomycetaceae bacterium]